MGEEVSTVKKSWCNLLTLGVKVRNNHKLRNVMIPRWRTPSQVGAFGYVKFCSLAFEQERGGGQGEQNVKIAVSQSVKISGARVVIFPPKLKSQSELKRRPRPRGRHDEDG